MLLYPIIAAFFIMLASLSGAFFASRRHNSWMERNLSFLATFSIGIFAVITWGLFEEAISHGNAVLIASSILAGVILTKVLSSFVPDSHHHHDPHPGHGHSHIDARKILIGDAFHNISDGLLIVPAFLADFRIGVVTAVGIFIHEFVQEVSEYFIYKEAGYSTREALFRNFITSSTIFIGMTLSVTLSSIESLEAPLIGIAAGGFLYIILRDLVPHTIHSILHKGRGENHFKALVLGILIMLGVNIFLPHVEDEAQDVRTELEQNE